MGNSCGEKKDNDSKHDSCFLCHRVFTAEDETNEEIFENNGGVEFKFLTSCAKCLVRVHTSCMFEEGFTFFPCSGECVQDTGAAGSGLICDNCEPEANWENCEGCCDGPYFSPIWCKGCAEQCLLKCSLATCGKSMCGQCMKMQEADIEVCPLCNDNNLRFCVEYDDECCMTAHFLLAHKGIAWTG